LCPVLLPIRPPMKFRRPSNAVRNQTCVHPGQTATVSCSNQNIAFVPNSVAKYTCFSSNSRACRSIRGDGRVCPLVGKSMPLSIEKKDGVKPGSRKRRICPKSYLGSLSSPIRSNRSREMCDYSSKMSKGFRQPAKSIPNS
ncbi:hypothetical protein LOZ06_005385, partial [Ophidiomyces ophidiicola]